MPIELVRLDQRFIHGQLIASDALANRGVNAVIMADEALCRDSLRQLSFNVALLAANKPVRHGATFVVPASLPEYLREKDNGGMRFLLLFGDMAGVLQALDGGVAIAALNLGCFVSKSHELVELYHNFKVSPEDRRTLDGLCRRIPLVYFGPPDDLRQTYIPAGAARLPNRRR
ncbi:MAG: PTS sugar transporter subunit IIB [Deltaproteobacteria bacterium]|jgi:mannose/fructose/N-acetylgalactosamine-specific phosphotransferase system component IIB|nr:PTS sugar transporter subunit IIB [Deltaproteobacteria bacterium]